MKKRILMVMLASLVVLPYARTWAEEAPKESAKDEKMETPEERQHEEQEAMEAYQKKVAKFGKDSAQAKKAWKHVVAEYKEHGDTPPAPDTAVTPSTTK